MDSLISDFYDNKKKDKVDIQDLISDLKISEVKALKIYLKDIWNVISNKLF